VVFRPRLTRRAFLAAAAGVAIGARAGAQPDREVLYHGITLPRPWPPRRHHLSATPGRAPYLASPPGVITIDVGRQLFVDDFLIEESSLYRAVHKATYHPSNPVLTPERPWEIEDPYAAMTKTPPSPAAMVYSDGVFFDPAERVFKMWYMAGYQEHTALAISHDGVSWIRPDARVIPGTNIVRKHRRDSSTVWLDLIDRDPMARYKMAWTSMEGSGLRLSASPDGVRWRDLGSAGPAGDRTTCFYNPFRQRWCFSLRHDDPALKRVRLYHESRSFGSTRWAEGEPVPWVAADARDHVQAGAAVMPELYNLDAVAYESVMLGLFAIFRGEDSDREKPNDLCVAFSRDGFHWSRPTHEPFIPVSNRQGDWNWANVQSAGGVCLIVGDLLHFYVSGRAGVPGTSMPGRCSTGLATLRRDGFVSITDRWPAGSTRPVLRHRSTLITRPVRFSGAHAFINADVAGAIRVEMLDREGRTIPGFEATRAVAITGDHTKHPLQWSGGASIASLANTVVRFRFVLDRAHLYAFWVSPRASGESRGYPAAGGPEFSGPIDRT
jgi:hypothetical protein